MSNWSYMLGCVVEFVLGLCLGALLVMDHYEKKLNKLRGPDWGPHDYY